MTVYIKQISTYNQGYFIVETESGDEMFCRLCDAMQWDELYDSLMTSLNILVYEKEYLPDGRTCYWVYLV